MKRIIILVVVCIMIGSIAFAATSNPVLFDSEGVRITIESGELKNNYVEGGKYLSLKVVVENKTDKQVSINTESCIIDDWEVESYCGIEVNAKKKKKDDISVYFEGADITDFSGVKFMQINLRLLFNKEYGTSKAYDGKMISGKWLDQNVK